MHILKILVFNTLALFILASKCQPQRCAHPPCSSKSRPPPTPNHYSRFCSIYDANDQWLDTVRNGCEGEYLSMAITGTLNNVEDYFFVTLQKSTGRYVRSGDLSCYFTSSDCSGDCLVPQPTRHALLFDGKTFKTITDEGNKIQGVQVSSVYWQDQCIKTNQTFSLAWIAHAEVKLEEYPIPAPLKVKPQVDASTPKPSSP